ncbi:hypothetical protein GQ54DRAFT_26818 [Martensiomyces pterosporus]|nr:hypothetical protein GQ54DRAFT_26818 [Martensiomyces pterosporus]
MHRHFVYHPPHKRTPTAFASSAILLHCNVCIYKAGISSKSTSKAVLIIISPAHPGINAIACAVSDIPCSAVLLSSYTAALRRLLAVFLQNRYQPCALHLARDTQQAALSIFCAASFSPVVLLFSLLTQPPRSISAGLSARTHCLGPRALLSSHTTRHTRAAIPEQAKARACSRFGIFCSHP